MNQHTYVICAYKESPFLEECIRSLKAQTVQSEIVMATSTPNDYIRSLADEYEIPLFVNSGPGGITQDWNFGYAQTNTPYVTIAHQDDIYLEHYTERMLDAMQRADRPLIYFTDYGAAAQWRAGAGKRPAPRKAKAAAPVEKIPPQPLDPAAGAVYWAVRSAALRSVLHGKICRRWYFGIISAAVRIGRLGKAVQIGGQFSL